MTRPYRYWSDKDISYLIAEYEKGTLVDHIGKELGRSKDCIRSKIISLRGDGIKIGRDTMYPAQATALKGQQMGKQFFKSRGIKILSEGHAISPEDFIIEYKGQRTAVNIKVGYYATLSTRNIKGLRALQLPVVFLWFLPRGREPVWLDMETTGGEKRE
ncbi:hypothetical protein D4R42_04730 [bacterium]|nr:MAG: hypothetical protein D4R42_04730 [bacterium]